MSTAPSFDAPAAEWLVYADSLQQQGDPRGELIALVSAGDAARRDAHVHQHAKALLGAAAPHFQAGLTLTWRWGFADTAEVRGSSAELVASMVDGLLAAPVAERLRALSIVGVPNAGTQLDLSGVVARVAGREGVPETLRELSLVDDRAANSTSLTSRHFEPANNLVSFGPLATLWNMKALRALKLVVADTRQLEPGTIDAPALESLTIHGLRLAGQQNGEASPGDLATALGEAKLPKLEVFDMRLCEEFIVNYLDDSGAYTSHDQSPEDEYGDEGHNEGADWPGEFGAALKTLVALPALRRLALTSFDTTASLLGLLASTGLPPTLKELDLSDSALSTPDLAWFTEHRALLSRLERLVVKNTGFTDADAGALTALGLKVEHSHRSGRRSSSYDDETGEELEGGGDPARPKPTYRYVIGMA